MDPADTSDDPGRLTIRLLPADQRVEAETSWRSLEERVDNVRLALSWDWTEIWLNHYGDVVPHRFAIAERAGEPVAVTLVTRGVGRKRGPFPLRTIHLGTAGEPPAQSVYVEGNGLLVLPDERERFAAALLEALHSGPWSWDELVLDGFDPDDAAPLLQAEPGFAVRTEVCRTFDLTDVRRGGGDFLAALRDSVAERVRYNRRRFEAKYGPVRAEWAEDLMTATSIFEDLKDLHQARWEGVGEPGVFASPRFAAFHEELIQRLHPGGKIALFRVSAGDQRIGCSYGFVEGTMVVNYQSGMAVFDQRRLSPGTLTNALCLEACLERGYDEYNWLAGDGQSKQELANAERTLVWATLQRGQRVRAINGTIVVGRQARRLQQQARAVREKQAARPPTSLVRRPLIRGKSEALAQMLTSSRGDRLLRRLPLWTGVLVLNYHRIGDHDASPFDRGVFSATAGAFDAHLAFLRKNADVIGLADLPNVLHRGRGRHVLLTFDDGYRDNYELAFPILRAHGLTATFFLCTGFLDDGHPSWWDEIAWMVRTSPLSELPAGPWFPQPIPLDESSREAAISTATTLYKQLPSDRAVAFHHDLAEITKSGRLDAAAAKDLWLSWDMAREMRAAGMTFGGHTVNHPILARLPPERQNAEIAGSAGRIEAELGERPRSFAYPVGHRDCFDATTRTALQAHGFELAFSFYGGAQPFAPFDPYDIRRVAVSHYLSFDLFTVLVTLPMLTGRK